MTTRRCEICGGPCKADVGVCTRNAACLRESVRRRAHLGRHGTLAGLRPNRSVQIAELDDALVGIVADNAPLTVRSAFYLAEARGLIDKTHAAYRQVSKRLVRLRRRGRIPYGSLTDGTRWIIRRRFHSGVSDTLDETARIYRRSLWEDQNVRVDLVTEKDALVGMIEPTARMNDVGIAVVRGQCSETFAFELAEDIRSSDVPVVMYGVGDHDPSGVVAWTSMMERVRGFLGDDADRVTFSRIAVTPEQIQEMNLRTRPLKRGDQRLVKNLHWTGEAVEVEAIPPDVLREIVRERIESHIDPEQLRQTRLVEAAERDVLAGFALQAEE